MNKSQLAVFLGVTLKTLSEWIARDADFPIIARGHEGADWVFDPIAVRKHVTERRAERDAAKAARLAQSALPLPAGSAASTTPKDDLIAWQVQRLRRQEAERAGLLVRADQMAEALQTALARLSRDAHAFLRQLGREHDWPSGYVTSIEKRFAETQRATVEALTTTLGSDDEPEQVAAA